MELLIILIIHHWHYNAEEGETIPAGTIAIYNNILRMLKPGGVLGIVEHRAANEMSRQASAANHRIPSSVAKADITSVGFILDGESNLLADHPEDDTTIIWRNNTARGMTQRIVQRYLKPSE